MVVFVDVHPDKEKQSITTATVTEEDENRLVIEATFLLRRCEWVGSHPAKAPRRSVAVVFYFRGATFPN